MAFVHEIKFFQQDGVLFSALFEKPTTFKNEYWIKNVPAQELGIKSIPENVALEQRYKVEDLGIKPFYFYTTLPELEFMDTNTAMSWKNGGGIEGDC